MSQKTKKGVLVRRWRSDAKAGLQFEQQLVDQAVEFAGMTAQTGHHSAMSLPK